MSDKGAWPPKECEDGTPIPNPAIWELHKSVLVKVGPRKRNMEVAVVRDGVIVAAFPTEKQATAYINAGETIRTQAAEISRLREALKEIANWGTSQPAALNMPEPDWYRMVCKQIGRAANAALTGDPHE